MLGTICGLVYGTLSAASMIPLSFPDKRAALAGISEPLRDWFCHRCGRVYHCHHRRRVLFSGSCWVCLMR